MRAVLAVLAVAHAVLSKDTLASVKRAFYDAKLVPDIVPAFDPEVLLSVTYNGVPFTAGAFLDPADTKDPPAFGINSTDPRYAHASFLVAILDPDAPKPQNPENAPYRHFLGADFASAKPRRGAYIFANASAALTEYAEPDPPAGSDAHRYAVLLYRQGRRGLEPPAGFNATDRANFNITSFVSKVNPRTALTLVGGTFFYVEKPKDDATSAVQRVFDL